jgi:hypothetical protein
MTTPNTSHCEPRKCDLAVFPETKQALLWIAEDREFLAARAEQRVVAMARLVKVESPETAVTVAQATERLDLSLAGDQEA